MKNERQKALELLTAEQPAVVSQAAGSNAASTATLGDALNSVWNWLKGLFGGDESRELILELRRDLEV